MPTFNQLVRKGRKEKGERIDASEYVRKRVWPYEALMALFCNDVSEEMNVSEDRSSSSGAPERRRYMAPPYPEMVLQEEKVVLRSWNEEEEERETEMPPPFPEDVHEVNEESAKIKLADSVLFHKLRPPFHSGCQLPAK